MVVVAIIGSRTINDYYLLEETILALHDPREITRLYTGDASGTDGLGRKFAKKFGIEWVVFKADWARCGRGAGYRRNPDIINPVEEVLALWDGKSKGTINAIEHAIKMNKRLYVIRADLEQQPAIWFNSVYDRFQIQDRNELKGRVERRSLLDQPLMGWIDTNVRKRREKTNELWIDRLEVRPEYRHKGYAEALLRHATLWASCKKTILRAAIWVDTVDVEQSLERNDSYYKQCPYEQKKARYDEWRGRQDAMLRLFKKYGFTVEKKEEGTERPRSDAIRYLKKKSSQRLRFKKKKTLHSFQRKELP